MQQPLWECQNCQRTFANYNQSHTCAQLNLTDHFQGKAPHIRSLYDAFVRMVEDYGPVTILVEKTRIAFHVRMSFAAVMPKQRWLGGHLVLAARYPSSHFRRIETFSKRNHLHAFRLEEVDQLDDEFREFIRMAYDVGEQRHLYPGG